jgi:hypothetical protein
VPILQACQRSPRRPERKENDMNESTGPVEMLAVSFEPGVVFQGRIADEIEKLETAGLIRVLDFLFLQKDPDSGALVRIDYDGQGLVSRLIDGDEFDAGGGGANRLTADDVRAVATALEPGAAAAFMVFEHVWSRELHQAIAQVGGVPFIEGFLNPEVVAGA